MQQTNIIEKLSLPKLALIEVAQLPREIIHRKKENKIL